MVRDGDTALLPDGTRITLRLKRGDGKTPSDVAKAIDGKGQARTRRIAKINSMYYIALRDYFGVSHDLTDGRRSDRSIGLTNVLGSLMGSS